MQGAEYQTLAMRTNDKKSTDRLLNKINDLKLGNHCGDTSEIELGGVLNAALGLSGEVGELNDMLKNGFSTRNSLILTTQRKKLAIFVGILQCFVNPSVGTLMKSCRLTSIS